MVSIEDLHIGTVIDIRDPLSFHDKHKYSIIVGISEDSFFLGTVYINSEINPSAINSPALAALQYPIYRDKYSFLLGTSYVDCSDMKDRMQHGLIKAINDTGRILGRITRDDMDNIVTLVLGAESIASYYKKVCNVVRPV
jgi:hypothetical protein